MGLPVADSERQERSRGIISIVMRTKYFILSSAIIALFVLWMISRSLLGENQGISHYTPYFRSAIVRYHEEVGQWPKDEIEMLVHVKNHSQCMVEIVPRGRFVMISQDLRYVTYEIQVDNIKGRLMIHKN